MELKSKFKLSLISLCVITPGIVFAKTCSPCSFNGWSVGIGLGATTFMTDINSSTTLTSEHAPVILTPALAPPAPVDGNILNQAIDNTIYRYGIMGALFAGYGQVYSNGTYLGAELGINLFGASKTSQKGNSYANYDVTHTDSEFGFFGDVNISETLYSKTTVQRNSIEPFLDLKAGYMVTPTTLAYFRGGVNYNTLKIKTNADYSVISDPLLGSFIPDPVGTSAQHSHSNTGFNWRAGAGIEVLITPDLGLGVDYVYTWYRNVKTSFTGFGNDVSCDTVEGCTVVPGTLTGTSKATVSDQEIMAQLIYHLGY